MKTRMFLFISVFALLVFMGCGGTGAEKSATLTFEMAVLQVDGEFLIHGIVYNDVNGDGVPGAVVTLVGMGEVMGEMTTISDGLFAFDVSEAGAYTVYETDPPGYTSTTPNEVPVVIVDADVPVEFGDRLLDKDPLVDVKPGSDINPLNLKSNGVLPAAICGSGTIDVTDINPDTLLLNEVLPLRWSYEDVCGSDDMPMDPDMKGDDEEMPDEYMDMTLKFSTEEIADSLGDGLRRGDIVTLTMTGKLKDGRDISGEETVWIVQVRKY